MEISENNSEVKPSNLWKSVDYDEYQKHVTISKTIDSTAESAKETNEKVVYMEDLEKRKQVYGICGECNEPGTGEKWCNPCNAKRFKDNFKNWTSGDKYIDEFMQQSQLNAVYNAKCLEWIPFETFKDVTYITKGGFGKIYSAVWPEGSICYFNIENQQWIRHSNEKVALKNPNTKDYMMVLQYCDDGNLRNHYLNESDTYNRKISWLFQIVRGLLDIHNAGKVHKDFHSEGIYGVLPYMAPEVLRGHKYTKASDIYSFGIMMNEYLSEEPPYNDIPHDHELFQLLNKLNKEKKNENCEIYSQIKECEKIRENKLKDKSSEKKSNNIQTHSQAIYTSRLLNFKNLPEPVNADNIIQSTFISKCFDCQLNESDLNQEDENETELIS
ncbi:kinase-like domain-containing protein [Glomus cerebriforme]|uniref:Kinase-like domain-containing protein n=1 Tax=Glomus cerebriforme TaxID=658196 RepID=A0A397SCS0_9GLOM|nr:kinase-like domain-containing protein [Glomus cerebriforme]